MNGKLSILIVGATGRIGSSITRACLKKDNLNVNILIRNPLKDPYLVKEVKEKGGKVIVSDFSNKESLKDITKGIHTIISALIGPEVFEIQMFLLQDAIINGVSRYVPAEYTCLDSPRVKPGENNFNDYMMSFRKEIEKTPIKGLHFHNGIFQEWYLEQEKIYYYGKGDEELVFTSYKDTGKYVAEAVSNPEIQPGDIYLIGERLTFNQVEEIYANETGNKLNAEKLSVEEGKNRINQLLSQNKYVESMVNGLLLLWSNGYGVLKSDNDKFPNVKPEFLISDYLRSKYKK